MSGKLTVQEVADSCTGWDEIAIEQAAGRTMESMQDEENPHQVLLRRCLAAIVVWREDLARDPGAKYSTAYKLVMGMTQTEVRELFGAEDEDDIMEGDPDSEVGKGDSPLPAALNGKPDSVSRPELHPTSTPV